MPISTTSAIVFLVAWLMVVLGMIFSIAEDVATARFRPWAYRVGPVLFRGRRRIPAPLFRSNTAPAEETETGLFKMIAPGIGLFHARLTDLPRWPWPLPQLPLERIFPKGSAKGTIRWAGLEAEVEVRLSLGPSATGTAWLAAATVLCIIALRDPELHRFAVIALPIAWMFVLGLLWVSIWQDRRRLARVLDELEKWFNRAAA